MKDHEHLSHLIPDYINGALDEADRILVEQAIASSPTLKEMHDEFLLVFETLNTETIKHVMQAEAESVHVILPIRAHSKIKIPKLMIGITTSIAACLLLWVGISKQNKSKSNAFQTGISSTVSLSENIDEFALLELQSEEVEEVILDDVLNLYVSDIETDKEINRLLEEEITQYLLKENQDEDEL